VITDFDKSFWEAYYQAEVQDRPPELARFIGQLETWTQLADPHQADQRSAAIEPLKQRLASMLAATIELDAAPHVLYRQEMIKCGKATCKRCSTGPAHGPYWYAFTTTNGKTTKKYLGKELPKTFRPGRDTAHPYNPAVIPHHITEAQAGPPVLKQTPAPATISAVKLQPPRARPARGRQLKTPTANFWLVDREADMLAFRTQEEAERWANKLNTKWKIYEASSRDEAWKIHQTFLVRQANRQAIW